MLNVIGFIFLTGAFFAGILALNRIKLARNQLSGRGMAIAGIAIPIIVALVALFIFPALFYFASSSSTVKPFEFKMP